MRHGARRILPPALGGLPGRIPNHRGLPCRFRKRWQPHFKQLQKDIDAAFADDLIPLATGNSPAAEKNYETFFCSSEEASFCSLEESFFCSLDDESRLGGCSLRSW